MSKSPKQQKRLRSTSVTGCHQRTSAPWVAKLSPDCRPTAMLSLAVTLCLSGPLSPVAVYPVFQSIGFVSAALIYPALVSPAWAKAVPALSLAKNYHKYINLSLYQVSEKYDGARAWWDGRNFRTRGGHTFNAPSWFTRDFPPNTLDGELWIGHGQFQELMQTIRDDVPDEDAWRKVRYMVFDAPTASGNFRERQQHLSKILSIYSSPWMQMVVQRPVDNHDQLRHLLLEVTDAGGEGLMLQHIDRPYTAGRHDGLLKMKLHEDAEAIVVAYTPGKGKYTGMMGSLLVEDQNGVQFRLGSGFSDAERRHPPVIGAQVTFRFQGRTQSGKPRFARYIRIRSDE